MFDSPDGMVAFRSAKVAFLACAIFRGAKGDHKTQASPNARITANPANPQ